MWWGVVRAGVVLVEQRRGGGVVGCGGRGGVCAWDRVGNGCCGRQIGKASCGERV